MNSVHLLCFGYRLHRSSNGHESIGTAAVAIRGGEARIPEGAEAWRQCGGSIWSMMLHKATKKTNRNSIGRRVIQNTRMGIDNSILMGFL
jgi:hypothetical protein